ncbi:tetraacyldisaccharide 4'-kinase [Acidihalobacter prosperus]
MRIQEKIETIWYSGERGKKSRLLSPLSYLYAYEARRRRRRFLESPPSNWPVPVIVVGNITVGGTGKTPMVIWLVNWLRQKGWRPGVISRGYKGRNSHSRPIAVTADDDPLEVGDEPYLIARKTDAPVIICRDRASAVRLLLQTSQCDIVVSDDGLQHYGLYRDLEIAMLDGSRRLGNGYCLPAGPLREPPARLLEADYVLVTDGDPEPGEYRVSLNIKSAYQVVSQREKIKTLLQFKGHQVHAVAGIGHPERFFSALENVGLNIIRHPLPDHHLIKPTDIAFGDDRDILITEKDAVKCQSFASDHIWGVPVEADPDPHWINSLSKRLGSL